MDESFTSQRYKMIFLYKLRQEILSVTGGVSPIIPRIGEKVFFKKYGYLEVLDVVYEFPDKRGIPIIVEISLENVKNEPS
jgi:hypothetical protein